jgi:hypothetical protein
VIILIVVSLVALNDVTKPGPTIIVSDKGDTLGYVEAGEGKRAVRDTNNNLVGYIDDKAAYDRKGHKVGHRSVGLLFLRKL